MTPYEKLLLENRAWAQEKKEHDPHYFERLISLEDIELALVTNNAQEAIDYGKKKISNPLPVENENADVTDQVSVLPNSEQDVKGCDATKVSLMKQQPAS